MDKHEIDIGGRRCNALFQNARCLVYNRGAGARLNFRGRDRAGRDPFPLPFLNNHGLHRWIGLPFAAVVPIPA